MSEPRPLAPLPQITDDPRRRSRGVVVMVALVILALLILGVVASRFSGAAALTPPFSGPTPTATVLNPVVSSSGWHTIMTWDPPMGTNQQSGRFVIPAGTHVQMAWTCRDANAQSSVTCHISIYRADGSLASEFTGSDVDQAETFNFPIEMNASETYYMVAATTQGSFHATVQIAPCASAASC